MAGFNAHKVLIPQMALLEHQAEATEGEIEKMKKELESHIQANQKAQEEAERAGEYARLDTLKKEESQLYASFDSLNEGLGSMEHGNADQGD